MTLTPPSTVPTSPVRTVVIPVAGRGSRLFPATKSVAKVLLPVGRRPLIHYAVEEAVGSGAERVILITNPNDSQVCEYFEPNPELEQYLENLGRAEDAVLLRRICSMASIVPVPQASPQGLADSIRCAQPLLQDEPFGVILPDALILADKPCLGQLIESYGRLRGTIIATREVEPHETVHYGILAHDQDTAATDTRTFPVLSMMEKPRPESTPSLYGVFGRYVLEPGIFEAIESIRPAASGELQLTDALNCYCKRHRVYGHRFEGEHFDTGDWLGLAKATVACVMADPVLQPKFSSFLRTSLET